MSVLKLSKDDMPSTRHILKYVQLKYEVGDTGEEKVICSSDPISTVEHELLRYSQTPAPKSRVLLHSCCAPCSGAMVEEMRYGLDLDVTVFFYNPNIHPRKEYEIRKEENIKHARKHNIPFVDCDYDSESWFKRMVGFELEPERGVRCSSCFDMRMEVAAAYANMHGFKYLTTTNATSRWKDETQVNLAGIRAVNLYSAETKADSDYDNDLALQFWVYNWKTDVMTRRKYEVSVEEKFYKQEYCGCSYSLRDSNIWRAQQGIPPVVIGGESAGLGTRYFEDVEVDAAEESQEVVDSFFKDATSHFGDDTRVIRQQAKLVGNTALKLGRDMNPDQHQAGIAAVFQGRVKSAEDTFLNNW
jgi:predicted adenine nucleotide alpha hydrolase (AANH) superfamily ATPase